MLLNPLRLFSSSRASYDVTTSSNNTEKISSKEEGKEKVKTNKYSIKNPFKSVPRIFLTISSFLSSAIQNLRSYHAKYASKTSSSSSSSSVKHGSELSLDPNLFPNGSQRQNAAIVKSFINPSSEPIFPGAVEKALEKVQADMNTEDTPLDPIKNKVLRDLFFNPPKDTIYTEATLVEAIAKEMKNNVGKILVTKNLQKSLEEQGLDSDAVVVATLLQRNAASVGGIGGYSGEPLKKEMDRLVLSMTTLARNETNYSKARNPLKEIFVQRLMQDKGIDKHEGENHQETRAFMKALEQSAYDYEGKKTTKNGGNLPVITVSEYNHILREAASPFFVKLGIQNTDI